MQRVYNATEARDNFSQIVSEAGYAGREAIIQRNRRPVAVIIGYEQYQKLLALRQQAQAREARLVVYDEIRARNADALPEQVNADVAEAIRAVRASR